jgi:hypothetical protein
MFRQFRIKLRNWWEKNNGERFVARVNATFQATINLCLGLLLVLMLAAAVLSAFARQGVDVLIYAVAAFVIAIIIRM